MIETNLQTIKEHDDSMIKKGIESKLILSGYEKCQPFLRWAGGKRWLFKHLDKYLPINGFNSYHEPFVGGGSILFYLRPEQAYISDLNKELMNTYLSVQNEVELLMSYLKQFSNTKEDYYKIRSKRYNNEIKEAARFIYLNSTSFNGIYRVNLNGEYNVPYGHRTTYRFDYSNLVKASDALRGVHISSGDFYKAIDIVKKGDLVFLDPPYTVTHNDNGFIKYNQKIFSINEQYRLSTMIGEIKEIGAYYILTNAAHSKIKEIFNHGDSFIEVDRHSTVGGRNSARGKYREIIMTNGV